MLTAGAKAPDFSLQDPSGRKVALSDILARGPALLALYKISCPVCQLTAPYLERLSKGSLQVIAISQDDARGTVRFQQTYGLTMPTLLDPEEAGYPVSNAFGITHDREDAGYPVSNAFGITHVPSLFLVEPNGAISLASQGFTKRDLEQIGKRAGVEPFAPGDKVPEWKGG